MSKKRVVISGMGCLSPLANSASGNWEALLAGKNATTQIEHFDTTGLTTTICGVLKNFDVSKGMSAKDARKFDPFIQYGVVAAAEAIDNSGFLSNEVDITRVGVIMGSGIGGMSVIENNYRKLLERSPRKISPFFVPGTIINMISGQISIQYGFTGPNLGIVTACTSGLHSIGLSARMIAYGDADLMVAGGAEKASTVLAMGGFCSARALSKRNHEPEKASRPWDKERDGFVLSDGAAVLVLEEYQHAKNRGANIIAEIIGFGMSGDAYHMTSPPDDGAGAALAMENALKDAQISASQVAYVNAHGTSTIAGDLAETVAVKSVFGSSANQVMVSSTKSMTGHMLGAAGAIETLICAQALRDQVVPATINLDNPGEGCDLDYVPHTARDSNLEYVLCNSFGFGGTNGSVVLKRV